MSKRRDNPKRAADEYLKDGSLVDYSVYQPKEPPKGLWRRKYPCRKSKGQHAYQLVKPNTEWMPGVRTKTVKDWYKYADDNDVLGWKVRHWQCVHCGSREMDSEENPNKKIRQNLYQE